MVALLKIPPVNIHIKCSKLGSGTISVIPPACLNPSLGLFFSLERNVLQRRIRRVHSCYTSHVTDLPCAGQSICLLIQIRTYFCEESSCARKIFAERLSPFVYPFARVTKRLCRDCADHWSGDRRSTWYACHRSPSDTILATDHSPAHHGTAHRTSWIGATDWH